ncbi:hypothetical protein [Croceicoccus estronivorus]|uniref:hypothetical protein n=1 Tax=Croceicoccus estronivorus TaxID=1172626 RepID=UPI0012E8905C|nr:hypothetical protein [Croceicoccus estronivorus]
MQSEKDSDSEAVAALLGGRRAETIRRLQIGLAGLAAMLMMIGLANIVMDRAKETEATTVPEAASTLAPEPKATPVRDPLADAGVVPDVPSSSTVKQDSEAQKAAANGAPQP